MIPLKVQYFENAHNNSFKRTMNSWFLLIWTPRIVQEKTFKNLDARLYSGS